jgi:hypothetical protein
MQSVLRAAMRSGSFRSQPFWSSSSRSGSYRRHSSREAVVVVLQREIDVADLGQLGYRLGLHRGA